ncbi:tumor susceptibility gene 101 protein-like isoform X2 [Mercenaria mercenaria]|uniref:tumor susceptibility gene 101 protein-like isoform X2 n=1 Tax=Mercenaria mercenaria TaxID=6596 RepID=UPI00234E5FE8|nr:tumor susceptibility gene 101 protein-like isoform X2 [Mercenaria mercenaria]
MSTYDVFLNTSLSKYANPDLAKRDVLCVFTTFSDMRPKLDTFGATYNIPVSIWLMNKHPYNPPIVYVRPTSTMQIKSGRYVDMNGKIDLPYLKEWKHPESDLLGLIQILTIVFGEEPPVYSTFKQGRNESKESTGESKSGFTKRIRKSNSDEHESDANCDTCQRAENISVGAEGYCVDCEEFFCKECLRYPRRLTATKNHKIFINDANQLK